MHRLLLLALLTLSISACQSSSTQTPSLAPPRLVLKANGIERTFLDSVSLNTQLEILIEGGSPDTAYVLGDVEILVGQENGKPTPIQMVVSPPEKRTSRMTFVVPDSIAAGSRIYFSIAEIYKATGRDTNVVPMTLRAKTLSVPIRP